MLYMVDQHLLERDDLMALRIRPYQFLFLLIFTAACSNPTATLTPEITRASMSPTPTRMVAPTDTVTPTPLPATATATSVPSPTALPPIPTADFAPEDIYGIWTRSDPERGNLFISILPEGGYLAAHGDVEGIVHFGKYNLDGSLFTFMNGWNCSPLPDETPGKYVLRLGAGGRFLYFDLYEDTCPDRPPALKSFRWNRFVPTPTPQP
jgi:hypothetical protein